MAFSTRTAARLFAKGVPRVHVLHSQASTSIRTTTNPQACSPTVLCKLRLQSTRQHHNDALLYQQPLHRSTTSITQKHRSIRITSNSQRPRLVPTSQTLRPSLSHRTFTSSATHQKGALTAKVAIIGAGDVGSTIAYSLVLNPIAGDVLLIDPKTEVRDAQAQDLSDSTYHGDTSTRVRPAEPKEAGQCDIIVITAGAPQQEGESRTDLIGKNIKILSSAIEPMKPFREDAIILVVANPVDPLTYFAQKMSGLPHNQVFGSGTFLDSARLRGILAERTGIAADSIEAHVLGEHGDSQLVAWSHAAIRGVPIDQVVTEPLDKDGIADETKQKAATISKAKGATNYGIGGVASSLCKSVLFDQRNIRPVSHWQEEFGVCLSMPAVIGREGIVRSMPMKLSNDEKTKLEESAKSMKEIIEGVEKDQ